jgi:tetratricopeptide (TPR) repeat protein
MSLSIRQRSCRGEHPLIAQSLNALGRLRRLQERAHEAVALHREALRAQVTTLDTKHPERAATLELLAQAAMAIGELHEAEAWGEEALAMLEERLGANHLRVAEARFTLAELRTRQARWDEAGAHCRQALGIVTRVLGPRHPSLDRHLDEYSAILHRADALRAHAVTSTTGTRA